MADDKFETQPQKIKRLEEENYKMGEEMVKMKEGLRNHNPALICPVCKKRITSMDSRIKITEHLRNNKVASWEIGAWKSHTIQQYHPGCWRKKK